MPLFKKKVARPQNVNSSKSQIKKDEKTPTLPKRKFNTPFKTPLKTIDIKQQIKATSNEGEMDFEDAATFKKKSAETPEQIGAIAAEPRESASFDSFSSCNETVEEKRYVDEFTKRKKELNLSPQIEAIMSQLSNSDSVDAKGLKRTAKKEKKQKRVMATHIIISNSEEPKRKKVYKRKSSEKLKTKLKSQNKRTNAKAPKKDRLSKKCETTDAVLYQWSQKELPENDPPPNLTHRERLQWLQEKRNIGLHVQCDKCEKFRFLENVKDPLELPEFWHCSMNPDKTHNKCSIPEVELSVYDEELLIYNLYHAGSVVWAKVAGYPWWPAMVDDCPDTEMYYWLEGYSLIPTWYHVVFFDAQQVTRAWLKTDALHNFKDNVKKPQFRMNHQQFNQYALRMECSISEALVALDYDIPTRLKKYSFLARWPNAINAPIDVCKKSGKNRSSSKSKARVKRKGEKSTDVIPSANKDTYDVNIFSKSKKEKSLNEETFKNKDSALVHHPIKKRKYRRIISSSSEDESQDKTSELTRTSVKDSGYRSNTVGKSQEKFISPDLFDNIEDIIEVLTQISNSSSTP